MYAIGSEGRYIKFGISRDLRKRLDTLAVGHPAELRLIGYMKMPDRDYARAMEKQVHQALAPYHVRGEWFKSCPKSMALSEMMGRLDGAAFDSIVYNWVKALRSDQRSLIPPGYQRTYEAWMANPESMIKRVYDPNRI